MSDPNHTTGVLESPALPAVPDSTFVPNSVALHPRRGRSLLGGLPTLLVVGLLGGLGWWGHHTGWKLPQFAAVFGNAEQAKDDWCAEHGVPESQCVECNPSLFARPKHYGFCDTHGVHQCPFEHPDVVQLRESPKVTQADLDRVQRALKFKDWPENTPSCKQHQRLIQFASQAVFDKMGVGVQSVQAKAMLDTVTASGEYTFEQPGVTPLYTIVAGRVWQVTALGTLGTRVKKGDVLALIEAPEVGKAKAEFLQAFAQVGQREQTLTRYYDLFSEAALSLKSLREAEAAAREAKIRYLAAQQTLVNFGLPVGPDEVKDLKPEQLASRVQFLGLPADLVARLDPATTTANLLPVRASRDGTIIDVKLTEGEVIDPGKTLFVVADTARMWLLLNVRPEDVKYLALSHPPTKTPGNRVFFQPDGGGPLVKGELVWQSKLIDEKTRTLQVLANVVDPPTNLAAHTFGKAKIVVREEPNAYVVPSASIHWEGDCHIVFVRDKNWFKPGAPKVFHVRTVRPGVTDGDETEILAGVLPGEIVATKNSSVLRAELLKKNLGAG